LKNALAAGRHVAKVNTTVDTMRAQFLPRPPARAIHSHKATGTSKTTITILAAVSTGLGAAATAARPAAQRTSRADTW
jgi:pyruvate/oxaloacetate carboxyltransferase